MKKTVIVSLFLLYVGTAFGQKYGIKKSKITFYSYAPIEDIEATNTQSKSFINLATGDVVFSVPIKGFVFEKSLMQEHFNENYMESNKYPNATFIGKIGDWEVFEGERRVKATGSLTIHGVKRDVTIVGRMTIADEEVVITGEFVVKIADHGIKIPKAVFYNIAEEIEVDVHFEYIPYRISSR